MDKAAAGKRSHRDTPREEAAWGPLGAFVGIVNLFALPWLRFLSWFASPTGAWPRDLCEPEGLAATFIEGVENQSASEIKN